MSDRTVHAACATFEVTRYERAGKWYVEPVDPLTPGQHIGVFDAAMRALSAESLGGTIHTGAPGGKVFDAKVRILRARHNLPVPA